MNSTTLFRRIFSIFCITIICIIVTLITLFWVTQNKDKENFFNQQRVTEVALLNNMIATFNSRGREGVEELLKKWNDRPEVNNVYMVFGDTNSEILNRPVTTQRIQAARSFLIQNPSSEFGKITNNTFGEEIIFFIRNWDAQPEPPHSPLFIPGLPLEPIWHEIIILSCIFLIGLLIAYMLTQYIIAPIRLLERGMERLASGDLKARVNLKMKINARKDELYQLGDHFNQMADKIQQLIEKERYLLHHVSHEMRSPLARMQAILALIEAQPKNQNKYLERLEGELERMNTLVGEFLTLSRLENANTPLEKEEVRIVPLLTNLVEDCTELAQEHQQTIELSVNSISRFCTITANESYLYRAFDNVIRNAIKYSPDGSTIQVNLSEDKDKKNWIVDIIDNGNGVKEEELPKLFNTFYRADSSSANKPGTGIGLALVKHIVEQHNGKVQAENVQPHGFKMHFVLPQKCHSTHASE